MVRGKWLLIYNWKVGSLQHAWQKFSTEKIIQLHLSIILFWHLLNSFGLIIFSNFERLVWRKYWKGSPWSSYLWLWKWEAIKYQGRPHPWRVWGNTKEEDARNIYSIKRHMECFRLVYVSRYDNFPSSTSQKITWQHLREVQILKPK